MSTIGSEVKHLEKEKQKTERKEHILVCLSFSPSNEKIIRTAAQMARAFGANFTALYVQTAEPAEKTPEDQARLQKHIRLAEQSGAEIFDITATKLVKLLGRDLTAAPAGAQESRIVRGTLYSAQTGGKTEKIFDPREQEIIQWVLDSRKRGEKCLDRGGGQRLRDSKRVQRACV